MKCQSYPKSTKIDAFERKYGFVTALIYIIVVTCFFNKIVQCELHKISQEIYASEYDHLTFEKMNVLFYFLISYIEIFGSNM